MSRDERPFARVYYEDLQRDYQAVWFDPTALSTWLRLLVIEDQSYPVVPVLPSAVRRADLERLTACELVALGPHRTYAVKGYRKEREGREAKARRAADARWPKDRPDADA